MKSYVIILGESPQTVEELEEFNLSKHWSRHPDSRSTGLRHQFESIYEFIIHNQKPGDADAAILFQCKELFTAEGEHREVGAEEVAQIIASGLTLSVVVLKR